MENQMPNQNAISQLPDAAFLDDLMERLQGVLSLLERDETLLLLQALRNNVDQEVDWAEGLAAQQSVLLNRIPVTGDYPVLMDIHAELNALEMERFMKVQSVSALHESCTGYRDLLAHRALRLVEEELAAAGKAPPPVPFALISMGSDGREEQTLITDQDYLTVYGDDDGAEADDYFREFSELLVERLASIGFKKCTGDIMPSNPTWRGSLLQWRRRLLAIVRYEYEVYARNLMDLILLSDARFVAGDQAIGTALVGLIRSVAARGQQLEADGQPGDSSLLGSKHCPGGDKRGGEEVHELDLPPRIGLIQKTRTCG